MACSLGQIALGQPDGVVRQLLRQGVEGAQRLPQPTAGLAQPGRVQPGLGGVLQNALQIAGELPAALLNAPFLRDLLRLLLREAHAVIFQLHVVTYPSLCCTSARNRHTRSPVAQQFISMAV